LLAELIDPIEGRSEQVLSPIDGVVYARAVLQFTQKGEILASVAGAVDLGRGAGLSP
jgi:predicted deacylase